LGKYCVGICPDHPNCADDNHGYNCGEDQTLEEIPGLGWFLRFHSHPLFFDGDVPEGERIFAMHLREKTGVG
jgi:hypothetical protein